jgi:S1-C subfamily serine protease
VLLASLIGAAILLVGGAGLTVWLFNLGNKPPEASEETVAEGNSSRHREELKGANLGAGVEVMAAKGLEELKAATVFVKVAAGARRATGSGFLIKVDGKVGYVATNNHVIDPGFDQRPRGGPPFGAPPEITLVFHSGTKDEQSHRGELVGAAKEQDLAVLKVSEVANLPRPIDIANGPKLIETLPVTVFGFPFGEALAMHKGNPTITVTKGSVSSIRRDDRDEVTAVQIDGALNPGNSGGPVVDSEGRLVGVAVATIRGAHIGLAIPGRELTRMLEGHVGDPRAVAQVGTDADARVEVEVPLIDPLRRIQAVTVHYLRSDLVKENPQPDQAGAWSELAGAQRLTLRLDGNRAVGSFAIRAGDKDKAITFQVSYVNGAGRLVYSRPFPMRVATQGTPVVRKPPAPVPVVRPPVAAPPRIELPPVSLPPPIKPPPLPEGEVRVALAGPVADVAVGGGGRYLVLRLAGKKKLAIFDVQQAKVVKELPLAEDVVHFAAGINRLVVLFPNAKLIQLWNLETFERERSALLPGTLTSDTIDQVCMGSASAGPLFVHLPKEKRTLALDLRSLETTEVRWLNWAPNNAYGPAEMRASSDGRMLIGWGGGWVGCDVAVLKDGHYETVNAKIEFWGVAGTFALPSVDGRFLYTSWAILDRAFNPAKMPELKNATVVPAAEPGYFLALPNTCNPGSPPPNAQAQGEMVVYTEDRKQLFFLRGLEELKAVIDLPWEKRVHYYPLAGLLVTLGVGKEYLAVRKLDLADQLEKSGADYLVILSRPPSAKAGTAYSYNLDVRSKKGGVKVKLESGPPGLKVTPEGQVSWNVPATPDGIEADVIVTVSDASGQETFHTFKIQIGDH